MSCDCRDFDLEEDGHVIRVITCPSCLPPGAIEFLCEDGRQLSMFSDHADPGLADGEIVPQVDSQVSVSALVEVEESDRSSDILKAIRLEDPSW